MFDLKKFTALAAIGAFTFGAAATTTYAAVPQQKEPPRAEQPAPQLNQDQKDKLGAKEDVIQIEQMGDYEGQNQKDIKDAKDVKDVEVKDIKGSKDVKEAKDAKDVKDVKDVKEVKGQQKTPDVKVIPVPQDKKAAEAKDAGQKAAPQDGQKVTQPEHK